MHIQFSLTIDSSDSAVQTANDVADILEKVAKKLAERFAHDAEPLPHKVGWQDVRDVLDYNGNTVGVYQLKITED